MAFDSSLTSKFCHFVAAFSPSEAAPITSLTESIICTTWNFSAKHQEFTFCGQFPSRFEARRPAAAPISVLRPIHSPFDAWFQLQASLLVNHKTVLPHPSFMMWTICFNEWKSGLIFYIVRANDCPRLYLCKHLIPCVVSHFIILGSTCCRQGDVTMRLLESEIWKKIQVQNFKYAQSHCFDRRRFSQSHVSMSRVFFCACCY